MVNNDTTMVVKILLA